MTAAAPAEEDWRGRAERAIGASLETLIANSTDGLPIAPLYARSERELGRFWRCRGPWSVAQRVDHPDAETANGLALVDLAGGADGLTLVYAASPFARGFGLDRDANLNLVLDKIDLDFIGLRLDAGTDTLAATSSLCALVERRTLTSAGLPIDLGWDPVGLEARTGAAPDEATLHVVLDQAERAGLGGCPLLADGRAYHDAGAGEALELAAVVATGVAYLRRLERAGLSLDAACGAIAFLLAIDADVFLGLAKARALRRLWARVETASGLKAKPIRLHAETSWRMMTRRDPWTNVMRATAATFAAGLGGADAITVLPFTLPIGLPDEPGRRLARNVQRVLIDEANLAMVDDPVAGSGGFEALTEGLCERAWVLFQDLEREGGIEASLRAGALAKRIAEQASARAHAVATLERGIVGTSRFPSLGAPVPAVLDVASRATVQTGKGGLPSRRDAAPYEALRDRADAIAATGGRPQVFLATLGPPAAYGPQATYAANLLAGAGLEAAPPLEERDLATLAADFAESGAAVACLCGTDKAYTHAAADAAKALRQKGARRILLVGRGADVDAMHAGGIDGFLYDGCNAPQVLSDVLEAAAGPTDRQA